MDVLIQLEWLSPSSLHLQRLLLHLYLRYSHFSPAFVPLTELPPPPQGIVLSFISPVVPILCTIISSILPMHNRPTSSVFSLPITVSPICPPYPSSTMHNPLTIISYILSIIIFFFCISYLSPFPLFFLPTIVSFIFPTVM